MVEKGYRHLKKMGALGSVRLRGRGRHWVNIIRARSVFPVIRTCGGDTERVQPVLPAVCLSYKVVRSLEEEPIGEDDKGSK